MNIIYTTLNNNDEARKIGKQLLEQKLANCVNFFPITCMYNFDGTIEEEPEVVLIVKTKNGFFSEVEKVIKANIDYVNFIGQFDVTKVSNEFETWLERVVK